MAIRLGRTDVPILTARSITAGGWLPVTRTSAAIAGVRPASARRHGGRCLARFGVIGRSIELPGVRALFGVPGQRHDHLPHLLPLAGPLGPRLPQADLLPHRLTGGL